MIKLQNIVNRYGCLCTTVFVAINFASDLILYGKKKNEGFAWNGYLLGSLRGKERERE